MTAHAQAWFRTTLPAFSPIKFRMLRFECVDDNCVVYLNGKKMFEHKGWASAFDVPLDAAWRTKGPNVLVVLVDNPEGSGGITKPVTLGIVRDTTRFDGLALDDRSWRQVDLPHDSVADGPFYAQADHDHGNMPVLPAWYRRKITVPGTDKGKRLWLYFEGVFRDATIYLNGRCIAFQDDGHDSFHVDITDHVTYGADNLLAVHVDPSKLEGWWYEGGGIYRHVWLNVADALHIVPWGVYVISEVQNVASNPSATLTIQTGLTNAGTAAGEINVKTDILDPEGKLVATASTTHTVPPGQDLNVE